MVSSQADVFGDPGYGSEILETLDAHAIVSVTDAAGTIVYANARFAELSGYATAELVGANHRILRSGMHGAAFFEDLWASVSQGKTWKGLICNRRRDGEHYWVETTIVPFLDGYGVPQLYVSVRTDVTELVEARQALQRSQHFAGVGSWEWRIEEGTVRWSAETAALFGAGHRPATVTFEAFLAQVHPDDREPLRAAVQRRLEGSAASYEFEHRVLLPDGGVRWVLERGDVHRSAGGSPSRMLGLVQDVTERHAAEERLARSERRWRAVMDQNRDAVLVCGVDGRITAANDAAERLFGLDRDALLGRTVYSLYPEDQRATARQSIAAVVADGDSLQEARIRRSDGRLRAVNVRGSRVNTDGEVLVTVAYRDVTEQRLIHGSRSDAGEGIDVPTGLLRRRAFITRLNADAAQRTAGRDTVAVALLRLENLAEIEAAFGAEIRRAVTVASAERLREAEPAGAFCGRAGDHEFVLGWSGLANADVFDRALDAVVRRLRSPFDAAGQAVHPQISVGTTVQQAGPVDAVKLVTRARVACNRAQGAAGSRVAFDARLEQSLSRRLHLERAMGEGLRSNAFRAVYQPQVALADGRLAGIEVLARWEDPVLGPVSPAEFIGLAERSGLLDAVCEQVFRQALKEIAPLLPAAGSGVRIALNVSPTQLRSRAFIEQLGVLISEAGLTPGVIELEITETAMLDDMALAARVIENWRREGFQIAIDDFGTGFSSMDHLRRLPVDRIKIDRSFVQGADRRGGDAAIVNAILGLAGPLGFDCVAEGIEHGRHYEQLRAAGCQIGQGYFIARPMAAAGLREWMQSR